MCPTLRPSTFGVPGSQPSVLVLSRFSSSAFSKLQVTFFKDQRLRVESGRCNHRLQSLMTKILSSRSDEDRLSIL